MVKNGRDTTKLNVKLTQKRQSDLIRNNIIIDASLLHPRDTKGAILWLEKQKIEISERRYYVILQERRETAVERLYQRCGSDNSIILVDELITKLELYQRMIQKELLKDDPNPVVINGYNVLFKEQPLMTHVNRQSKTLAERHKIHNELATV